MRDPEMALQSWFDECACASVPASIRVPARSDPRQWVAATAVGFVLAFSAATWSPAIDWAQARDTARYLASRQMTDSMPIPSVSAIVRRKPGAFV
ncbi:MAG: hypothetical protein M9921_05395 [Fimbriimonadaceae bacterium]|nr:hypothetical protein [Fimbriimonadaceae bacterium]